MRPYTVGHNDFQPRDNDGTLIIGFFLRRNIRQSAVTVGVSPTLIPSVPLARRLSMLIINNGTAPIYLGYSSVTTSDGFPLYPRAEIRIDIEDSVDVYGISTIPTEVRVLEGS